MTTTSSDAAKDLAPTGRIRAAINFGNPVLAQRDPATGDARGVTGDLARELAKRLGLPLTIVPYEQAGNVSDAAGKDQWDIAFLAVDPKRAAEIEFTAPYVIIEGVYVVPEGSPIRANDDVDRDGVRVSVIKGSAYQLYLSRTLKHAQIVQAPTAEEAVANFERDKLDVLAGVKAPQQGYVESRSGMRMLDGRFMAIEQAMGVTKGRLAGVRYLRGMLEELKSSGFIAAALERSGQRSAQVAPAAPV